jgi:hypothetical protein
MTHIGRILLMATLLGLLALTPTRTSAATLVPFQASVSENYALSICAPLTACIQATGTGHATYLGQVTEYASVLVDINPADVVIVNGYSCNPETRSTLLVAHNGDQITMSATGSSCSATSTTGSAHDSYVVTGETGRFQGASGIGTDSNTYMVTGQLPTGQFVGVAATTFSGNLSSPGALASSH